MPLRSHASGRGGAIADGYPAHGRRAHRPAMTRAIRWDLLEQNYDQMIKFATAIRVGTAPADIARVGSQSHLGRKLSAVAAMNCVEPREPPV